MKTNFLFVNAEEKDDGLASLILPKVFFIFILGWLSLQSKVSLLTFFLF